MNILEYINKDGVLGIFAKSLLSNFSRAPKNACAKGENLNVPVDLTKSHKTLELLVGRWFLIIL